MIGLSLSRCVSDILAGKVKEEQVNYLVVSCVFNNDSQLDEIIKDYVKYENWPIEKESEIRQLIKRLNIRQPRLQNDKHFPNIAWGHWVDSEDEII